MGFLDSLKKFFSSKSEENASAAEPAVSEPAKPVEPAEEKIDQPEQ
jgi:hypothetical protein